MHTELAADLGLPSGHPVTTTPAFECMLEDGVTGGGGSNRSCQTLNQQQVDYLCSVNSAALDIDSAVDLSVSSTFSHLLDCDLSVLEDWYPPPTTSTDSSSHQWPPVTASSR